MKTVLTLTLCLLGGLAYAEDTRQQEIDQVVAEAAYIFCMQGEGVTNNGFALTYMIERELISNHQSAMVASIRTMIRDYFHRAAHERCSARLGRDWRAPAPPLKDWPLSVTP